MNNQHLELFQRHERNPILTAAQWPYPVNSVFNPGAADTSIALATGSVRAILEWLERHR